MKFWGIEIDLIMEIDLRFLVLEHLVSRRLSSDEWIANDWLSTQHSDLGTIRRALLV